MNGALRDDRVARIARWRVQLYISSTETSSSLYCNGLPGFRVLLLSRGGYMRGKFLVSSTISLVQVAEIVEIVKVVEAVEIVEISSRCG
jgi:hypothetical protein